ITFDMGGTSTDVAHFKRESERVSSDDSPNYERAYETEVAGVRLRSPMMAIHTVAAGGGSSLTFDGERYRVGPDSAGAYPGPACYRNGGPLTVTDCNVMVGKIQPQFFPKVFGVDGQQSLDGDLVRSQFLALADEIKAATGIERSAAQVAEGFLAIATDNMANAIKKISVQKGYDIGDYTLCCFGAAGGQHACRLAESLGIKTIFIHPYAGVLSAYGMGLADRRVLKERSVERALTPEMMVELLGQMEGLVGDAIAELKTQGDDDIDTLNVTKQLHIRYDGTDSTLAVDFGKLSAMQQQFEQRYQQQYGITLPDKALIVSTLVAEAIGKTAAVRADSAATNKTIPSNSPSSREPFPTISLSTVSLSTVPVFSGDQWYDAPYLSRSDIQPGTTISGPAIILEATGTNIIEPGWHATMNAEGALILEYPAEPIQVNILTRQPAQENKPDPVRLEIFNSLFQSIAEQMGFTLQNTSSSVNIKERLDFSCAIFDAQGQLIANAPHIPVHLGSMGESVRALIDSYSIPFQPGDTFISNNPYNGGTHLPDVTAITPVFIEGTETVNDSAENQPLFFVASRGHHADIGGITPGSMPPNSTTLDQEGVLLDNFKLVDKGTFQSEALRTKLMSAAYPVRNAEQNLADLQAQIAANNRGMQELSLMVKQFGLGTVQAYMQHVQNNAEQAVRRVVEQLYQQHGDSPLTACVLMDCGAEIRVSISLKPNSLKPKVSLKPRTDDAKIATIDFTGTSDQQLNNFNAPLAVCKAAVLYVFRTLVDTPIPLNAGCLKPLEIVVPEGCLLNPRYPAAVVAGNVETSQAVTDALYGALGVLAASQGTMNNFTFGNERYQYYETICGGSGAGPTFAGTDAVQTHMTNSRLTDPEVLEMRFPVLLDSFSIRAASGGKG
ncbi:MAG: hydantoinase B/oxoprolinase family protein, partial [Cyanobacteria bacterium J06650_10]